jgi:hypothetical protein
MAVSVRTGEGDISFGSPQVLFNIRWARTAQRRNEFAVTPIARASRQLNQVEKFGCAAIEAIQSIHQRLLDGCTAARQPSVG